MPWLVQHGITNRGAKCAIIDHPIAAAKQVVYHALTGTEFPSLQALAPTWRDHVSATYRDPHLTWGDAACPDDTILVRNAVATLAQPDMRTNGIRLDRLAALLGRTEQWTRAWVAPKPRQAGGFVRPRFLAYGARSHVTVIECPHRGCSGTADAVVLLPEVAASGYGVLCSTCRRAPNDRDPKWASIVFPSDYLQPFTRIQGRHSLRTAEVSVPAPAAVLLDI